MTDYRPVHRQTPEATITPSLVRTLIPFLAGLVGTWLLSVTGLDLDSTVLSTVLSAGIGYLYYVVARFLEVFASDRWGYVLGVRKLPVYATPPLPDTVVAEPSPGEVGAASLADVGFGLCILAVVAAVLALGGVIGWLPAVVLFVAGAGCYLFSGAGRP